MLLLVEPREFDGLQQKKLSSTRNNVELLIIVCITFYRTDCMRAAAALYDV